MVVLIAPIMPSFHEICGYNYKEQLIWFLNGFWNDGAKEAAEDIWGFMHLFITLNKQAMPPMGIEGNSLDQFGAARFLETADEALTAQERKDALRSIDANNDGRMALIEYLAWRYKHSPEDIEKAPQGEDSAALKEAEAKMAEVTKALEDLLPKLEAAKQAAVDASVAERNAFAAAGEAKAAEEAVKMAEAELQAAVDELNAQEEAYNGKIADLTEKAADMTLGVVKRNKAANECEQLKAEDPLPLRKAKITQGAALKKVQKKRVRAEEATANAQAAAAAATEAKLAAEAKAAELDAAYVELQNKMTEAEQELAEAKAKGGPANGNFWVMGRELFEADKSLPRSRQRFNHDEPFKFEE